MVLLLVIFNHNVYFFVANGITKTCWYSIILRVLYNVKFITGGIHVREAFIRSLMVRGGHRSVSLTGMRIQGQVSSTPKRNDSEFKQKKSIFFCVERTIYAQTMQKIDIMSIVRRCKN